MHRRTFLRSGAALPVAAMSGLPAWARANAATASVEASWRVFDVATQVEVTEPAGVSRVWLPVPLTADTDYFKNLGSTWGAEGGAARFIVDAKSRAVPRCPEIPRR